MQTAVDLPDVLDRRCEALKRELRQLCELNPLVETGRILGMTRDVLSGGGELLLRALDQGRLPAPEVDDKKRPWLAIAEDRIDGEFHEIHLSGLPLAGWSPTRNMRESISCLCGPQVTFERADRGASNGELGATDEGFLHRQVFLEAIAWLKPERGSRLRLRGAKFVRTDGSGVGVTCDWLEEAVTPEYVRVLARECLEALEAVHALIRPVRVESQERICGESERESKRPARQPGRYDPGLLKKIAKVKIGLNEDGTEIVRLDSGGRTEFGLALDSLSGGRSEWDRILSAANIVFARWLALSPEAAPEHIDKKRQEGVLPGSLEILLQGSQGSRFCRHIWSVLVPEIDGVMPRHLFVDARVQFIVVASPQFENQRPGRPRRQDPSRVVLRTRSQHNTKRENLKRGT